MLSEGGDFVEVCASITKALFQCQSEHAEHFEALMESHASASDDDDDEIEEGEGEIVVGKDTHEDNDIVPLQSSGAGSTPVENDGTIDSKNAEPEPESESEVERMHWEVKKTGCSLCAFCLESPCAEEFKPWSRCIDKSEAGIYDLPHTMSSRILLFVIFCMHVL